MRFTVLFQAPYWVGILEDERAGLLYAGKTIFGAEPSDAEIYAFALSCGFQDLLASLAGGVPVVPAEQGIANFKRRQRQVRRQLAEVEVASKAHEAIRLQLEQHKQERKVEQRAEREAEADRKWQLTRQKAKAKHRGH